MALINCIECNHHISSSTNNCPHCGFDFQNQRKQKTDSRKLIFVCIILAIVMGLQLTGKLGDVLHFSFQQIMNLVFKK